MQTFPSSQSKHGRILLLLALVATVVVSVAGISYPFVFDDSEQIVNNTAVHSWEFATRYFTSDVWPHTDTNAVGTFYRPVFQVWLLINYKLGGLNPVWWHLTSLLLHLVVVGLAFILARLVVNDELIAGSSALLFGVMPVHVEAVTWISGSTEPLMGMFFLASFISHIKTRSGPSTAIWRVASLVLYTLAMFSKETALVMPAVIFFASWFLSSVEASEDRSVTQRFVGSLRESIPFIVLTLAYVVARYFALHGLTHSLTPLPFTTLLLTWPSVLLFYVRLMIWPFGLSAFYETPYITSFGFSAVVLPLVILILLAVGLFLHARSNRVIAFFTIWMVLPILPLLNLSVFKDGELAHDRYLYLPSVGFCILLSMALQRINFGSQTVLGQPLGRVAVLFSLVAIFGIVTLGQTSIWASDFALALRGMEVAPRNNMAANNYAKELALRGEFASAVPIFHQVIERRPNYWLPTFNLGFVYFQLGDLPQAERYLRRAISIFPNDAAEHRYLGFALLELKRNAEAETELRTAIALQPSVPDQHFALGMLLEERGALTEALGSYNKEREINPKQPEVNAKIADLESRLSQASPK